MTACLKISPRERVLLALDHRTTDRIPIAMVCSGINPAARTALEEHLRRQRGQDVDSYLAPLIDIKGVAPAYKGPPLPPRTDIWGVRRAPMSYGAGAYEEIDHYPLAEARTVDDVLRHRFPSTAWFDYASLPERIAALDADRPYCLMASNGNIFETSWYMRGFENLFMDLATAPGLAHAILERVTAFYVGHFTRILQAARGRIDLVFTADDIAGQEGLLLSPAMWREHLMPYHVRLNKAIHGHGARVIYHTDGAVMEAVGGLVAMGIDVLQALQFDAKGMDAAALKRGFGSRLCFEGGVSVQRTLPFGTPEDVRRETEDRIRVLGAGGGYILGPSHYIQDGTPPENIVAMFDAAGEYFPLG